MIAEMIANPPARYPSVERVLCLRQTLDNLLDSYEIFGYGCFAGTQEAKVGLAGRVWGVGSALMFIWRERIFSEPDFTAVTGWPDGDRLDTTIASIGDVIHRLRWSWQIVDRVAPSRERSDFWEEISVEKDPPVGPPAIIEGPDLRALKKAYFSLTRILRTIGADGLEWDPIRPDDEREIYTIDPEDRIAKWIRRRSWHLALELRATES